MGKIKQLIESLLLNGTPVISEDNLYKVRIGNTSNKNEAIEIAEELTNRHGYETYIVEEDGFFQVQIGAFNILENAIALSDELSEIGFEPNITKLL